MMADLVVKGEVTVGKLTIRAKAPVSDTAISSVVAYSPAEPGLSHEGTKTPTLSISDLPLEVQGSILDYLMGEVHAVNSSLTSIRGRNVSSSMRHPRRKAISDLALVSRDWRELVQERIYRHVKIKGTRKGLADSEEYFSSHWHVTKHVRHIEFWVPVWGDKASIDHRSSSTDTNIGPPIWDGFLLPPINPYDANQNHNLMTANANELLSIFTLSLCSATLSEIFRHTAAFFTSARIFTLEGGHCKKSNMIRHFPELLFKDSSRLLELDKLPQIRTFAMRGAWNIMRDYTHWTTIESALPNVEEWHCGYAKPRLEAYATINTILLRLPIRLRHVNISLDGMYSKDNTSFGSCAFSATSPHLCEYLGRIAPQLESLSFTGKLCSCFWQAACDALPGHDEPRLRALEMVVKSCCRQRVTNVDPETGETVTDELGGVMADGAGITNLSFIKAFERLTLATVESLDHFPLLEHIRIRFIDLDSPCALLNPYFQVRGTNCYGLWSEEIVEALAASERARVQGLGFVELGDGINTFGTGVRKDDSASAWGNSVYPKTKPRAIKSSVYRILADARVS